jgi:hypothetical protein
MLASPDAEGRGDRKGEGVNEDRVMPQTDAQASFEAWALRLQLLAELRALAGDEPEPAGAPTVSP